MKRRIALIAVEGAALFVAIATATSAILGNVQGCISNITPGAM